MRGILTVAHVTVADARRRRVLMAALLCAVAFLAVFDTALFFAAAEYRGSDKPLIESQAFLTVLMVAGLYAVNVLSVLLAVLLPVDTLSGEIESGVMQTIASKPIRRADVVLGKWLGHALIVVGYLVGLATAVLVSARLLAGVSAVHVGRALPLMALEVVLLVTVTIAGGTRLSTVTNGVVALGFYGVAFVGGWIEQVGTIGGIQSARTIGILASLISPPDAMWRLAVYHLQPAIVRSVAPTVFGTGSIPSPPMVWWAIGFTAVTLGWAVRSFGRRAL